MTFLSIDLFYLGFFVGVMTLGELVLIPGIYVSYVGPQNMVPVLLLAITAASMADALWYTVGLLVPRKQLMRYRLVSRGIERASGFTTFFRAQRYRMIFFSKFFIGTRIIVQILAGIDRVSFPRYIAVNVMSSTIWVLAGTLIGVALGATLRSFQNAFFEIQIAVMISVGVITLAYYLGKRFILSRLDLQTDAKRE